tara:strand:+ start:181 stop:429 length:249 start_codon:yes stop_codon:yes gene_type:complete
MKKFTFEQIQNLNLKKAASHTKYPWRDISVGEGFFVSEKELPSKDCSSRPTPPDSLTSDGYKVTTSIQVIDKQKGIFVQRVA